MIKTDGIIFDMDGTIWDNTGLFAASWTRAAAHHGYKVNFTVDMLKGLFGKTMKDIADACIPDEDPEKRYATLKDCEIFEMEDLRESKTDTTYKDLEKTLETLTRHTNLYIVSNCQSGYIETFFEISGCGKYFKDYLCYGDNGLPKADNIKLIAEKYEIKHPVYVGDIQGDKNACDEAGVDFIWAAYGYGENVDSYVAKIDDVTQLTDIIEGCSEN